MLSTTESADCNYCEGEIGTSWNEDSNNNNVAENEELVEDIKRRMILHWNYRNLKEFPRELLEHGDHVKEIYLKRNSIIKLPPDVGRLKNLTNIYLCGNQFRTLSTEIGELVNLEVLDVSQNCLQTLPSSIGNLVKLLQLVVTQNQLISLPKELSKLTRLKYLELSDNQLQVLDEDIFRALDSLEELGVDRNPIQYLPRSLTGLRNLRSLSVCKCDLRFLPGRPFYFSVSRSSGHRHRNHGSRRNPANLNEPDEPAFLLRFDGNANLNYIPYWMIRLLGPCLESYGCNRPSQNAQPQLKLPSANYKCDRLAQFAFDKCLRNIRHDKGVPTLVEHALRCLHANRDCISTAESETIWTHELPAHLARLLIIGPFSQCFQCFGPIFTELWPLFFRLQTDAVPMEISEMLYPHGTINAYNNHQMNQAMQNGFPHGFNFSYLSFCSHNCKHLFSKVVNSGSYYPFHDYRLILDTQLSSD